MNGAQLARWRLHTLGLTTPRHGTPVEVVDGLCAVQSQDYGPATWSVGQRLGTGATAAVVHDAFARGELLRTHVLRPTWHFVTPADIRWLLALTGPRVQAFNAHYYRREGLDTDDLARSTRVIAAALRGGNALTRKELGAVLAGAGVPAEGLRLGLILMNAELDAVICSGPPSGRQQTYSLLEERAPDVAYPTGDAALAALVRRYFTSHGPASAKDLRWWSSLTLADIAHGLDLVGPGLDSEVVDGVRYWFAGSPPTVGDASPTVHLLQAYDEYTVGYSETKYLLDVSGVARAHPGGFVFNHVVVLDNQVVGCWKRTVKRDAVQVEADLVAPLDATRRRALQRAADAHGAFLGLPATVVHRAPGTPPRPARTRAGAG